MDDLQREIDRVEKRTRRYWFDDGLVEIASGSGFLLVALYILVAPALEQRLPNPLLNLVFPALVLAVAFAARRAVHAAKARYIHPRTGYLSLDRKPARPAATAVVSLAVAAVLAFLAVHAQSLREWIPALTGVVLAVGFLVFGQKTGLARFPLAGFSIMLVGLLVSWLHVGENLATAVLFGWVGLALIAGGVAALLAYLRHAPPPADHGAAPGGREDA